MIFFVSDANANISFELSSHKKNGVAIVTLKPENFLLYSKKIITQKVENSITLQNCGSVDGVIIDFSQFKKANIGNLLISSFSACKVIFKNDDDVSINSLLLKNVTFQSPPHASINHFKIKSYEAIITAVPENTLSIDMTVTSSEDMNVARKLITGVNIIPGSGEYVYDTDILYEKNSDVIMPINVHNNENIADSLYNIKELKETCPNLLWVAPTISWFAHSEKDSLDIADLKIDPGVNSRKSKILENWSVGKYNRTNAYEIKKNHIEVPNFGGSVSDQTLLRYIKYLKKSGYKVMFYPFLMVDMKGKPWRGHIKARNSMDVRKFFNKESGYNDFILHYANLLKGYVDAFVIGSEMQGLTGFADESYIYPHADRYPAVVELIALSKKVKEILGKKVIITYAANWGEYHHTGDRIYNLDPLWASESIDVVGIDAYIPLTSENIGDISVNDIKKAWESGELWDYYYQGNKKTPLSEVDGLKRIEYWWSNEHVSHGFRTVWIPKMKPIWFTEFGFPSVHLATHKPSIFYDPETVGQDKPIQATEISDFQLQARAIRATLEHWKNKKYMIQNAFLWAWDARPYPAFPKNTSLWVDGKLWSKGHWINGKIKPSLEITITSKYKTKIFRSNVKNIDVRLQ